MNPALVSLLLTFSLAVPAMADGASTPVVSGPATRVRITISASEEIRNLIYQQLAESLNQLGGVQVVEELPRWTIQVVTSTLQDADGRIQGVGMSFVILEHGPQMQMLATMAQAWRYVMAADFLQDEFIKQGMRELIRRVDSWQSTPDLTILSDHKMCVIPVDQIPEACRDIVSNLGVQFQHASTVQNTVAPAGSTQPMVMAMQ